MKECGKEEFLKSDNTVMVHIRKTKRKNRGKIQRKPKYVKLYGSGLQGRKLAKLKRKKYDRKTDKIYMESYNQAF